MSWVIGLGMITDREVSLLGVRCGWVITDRSSLSKRFCQGQADNKNSKKHSQEQEEEEEKQQQQEHTLGPIFDAS